MERRDLVKEEQPSEIRQFRVHGTPEPVVKSEFDLPGEARLTQAGFEFGVQILPGTRLS